MIYGNFAKSYSGSGGGNFLEDMYIPDFTIGPCIALEMAADYNKMISEAVSYDVGKVEAFQALTEAGISSIIEAIKNAFKKLIEFIKKIIGTLTGSIKKKAKPIDVGDYDEAKMKKAIEGMVADGPILLMDTGGYKGIINDNVNGLTGVIDDAIKFIDDSTDKAKNKSLDKDEFRKGVGSYGIKMANEIFSPTLMDFVKSEVGSEPTISDIRNKIQQMQQDPNFEDKLMTKCGIKCAICGVNSPKEVFEVMKGYNFKGLDETIKKINSLGDQLTKICNDCIGKFDKAIKKLQIRVHPDNGGDVEISQEVNAIRELANKATSGISLVIAQTVKSETDNFNHIQKLQRLYTSGKE